MCFVLSVLGFVCGRNEVSDLLNKDRYTCIEPFGRKRGISIITPSSVFCSFSVYSGR
jgi:hypothetical protein